MVYVSAFLFLCWLCFGYLLFLFSVFVLSYFLFCFQSMKQSCFPCNSGAFSVMLVKRVVCFFVLCLCSCLFRSCVVCFNFQEVICIILFLCCFLSQV